MNSVPQSLRLTYPAESKPVNAKRQASINSLPHHPIPYSTRKDAARSDRILALCKLSKMFEKHLGHAGRYSASFCKHAKSLNRNAEITRRDVPHVPQTCGPHAGHMRARRGFTRGTRRSQRAQGCRVGRSTGASRPCVACGFGRSRGQGGCGRLLQTRVGRLCELSRARRWVGNCGWRGLWRSADSVDDSHEHAELVVRARFAPPAGWERIYDR